MKKIIFTILIMSSSLAFAQTEKSSCLDQSSRTDQYQSCLNAICPGTEEAKKTCSLSWMTKDQNYVKAHLTTYMPVECTKTCSDKKGCFPVQDYSKLDNDELEFFVKNVLVDAESNLLPGREVGEACESSLNCASLKCENHACVARMGCRFGVLNEVIADSNVDCESGLEKSNGKCVNKYVVDHSYSKLFENFIGGGDNACNVNLDDEKQVILNEVNLNLRAFEILFSETIDYDRGTSKFWQKDDRLKMKSQFKTLISGFFYERRPMVEEFNINVQNALKDFNVLKNLDPKATSKVIFRGKEVTQKALAARLSDGKDFIALQKDFELARSVYEKKMGLFYLKFVNEKFNPLLKDYGALSGGLPFAKFGNVQEGLRNAYGGVIKLEKSGIRQVILKTDGGISSSLPIAKDEIRNFLGNETALGSSWLLENKSKTYLIDPIVPNENNGTPTTDPNDNIFHDLANDTFVFKSRDKRFASTQTTKLLAEWHTSWKSLTTAHFRKVLNVRERSGDGFQKYVMADPDLNISEFCVEGKGGEDSITDCSSTKKSLDAIGDRVFSQMFLYSSNGWKRVYWTYFGGEVKKEKFYDKSYDINVLTGPRGHLLTFMQRNFYRAGEYYKALGEKRSYLVDEEYIASRASCLQATVMNSNTQLDGSSTSGATTTGGVNNIPNLPNFFGGFVEQAFKGGSIQAPVGSGSNSNSNATVHNPGLTNSSSTSTDGSGGGGGLVFGIKSAASSGASGSSASGSSYGISDSSAMPSVKGVAASGSSKVEANSVATKNNFKFSDQSSGSNVNFNSSSRDSTNANFSGLTASEQGVVLSQAERVQPSGDELFDRVSHAYVTSGYKRVLNPSRVPAGQKEKKSNKRDNQLINKLKSF